MAGDLPGTRLSRRPRQCVAALAASGQPLHTADVLARQAGLGQSRAILGRGEGLLAGDCWQRSLDPVLARPLPPSRGGAGDAAGLARASVRRGRACDVSKGTTSTTSPRDSLKPACAPFQRSKSAMRAAALLRPDFRTGLPGTVASVSFATEILRSTCMDQKTLSCGDGRNQDAGETPCFSPLPSFGHLIRVLAPTDSDIQTSRSS